MLSGDTWRKYASSECLNDRNYHLISKPNNMWRSWPFNTYSPGIVIRSELLAVFWWCFFEMSLLGSDTWSNFKEFSTREIKKLIVIRPLGSLKLMLLSFFIGNDGRDNIASAMSYVEAIIKVINNLIFTTV